MDNFSPTAHVTAISFYDEDSDQHLLRQVSRTGVDFCGSQYDDDEAMNESFGQPVVPGIWSSSDDPVDILIDLGEVWAAEREKERMAASAAYQAIRYAASKGVSEVEMSKRLNVDRMTIRRALGKR
jgi:hypothetical protein